MKNWIVLCVTLFVANLSVATQNQGEKIIDKAQFADVVPQEAIAYFRIPTIWGLLSAPKGNGLNSAFKNDEVQKELANIQPYLGRKLVESLPQNYRPVIELLVDKLHSPLEVVVLSNDLPFPVGLSAVIGGRFDFENAGQLNQHLSKLAQYYPVFTMEVPATDISAGTINLGVAKLHYNFDIHTQRMNAVIGMLTPASKLKEIKNWTASGKNQVMASYQNRIDQSGHGLFVWADLTSVTPLLNGVLPAPSLANLQSSGMLNVTNIAFGEGVAQGVSKFRIIASGAGSALWDLTLPINDAPEFMVGNKSSMVVGAQIPSYQWVQKLFGASDDLSKTLTGFEKLAKEQFGVTLQEVFTGLNGQVHAVSGEVGSYYVYSPFDADAFELFVQKLTQKNIVNKKDINVAGNKMTRLTFDLFMGSEDPILSQFKSRLYYQKQGGHFVVAKVPQIISAQKQIKKKITLKSWMANKQINNNSALWLLGEFKDGPRNNYYTYMNAMQWLGDYVDYDVDLSGFPTAYDLKLPKVSQYGVLLGFNENEISFGLNYESFPGEFLQGGNSMVAVAAVGVLAAVAIPAYQDYINKAQFSGVYVQLNSLAMQYDQDFVSGLDVTLLSSANVDPCLQVLVYAPNASGVADPAIECKLDGASKLVDVPFT